jgi:hypothetical protein
VHMVAPMTPMQVVRPVNLVLEILRAVPAMTLTAVDNNNQVDTALADRVHPITTTKTKAAEIHTVPANKAVDNRRMVVLAPRTIPTEEPRPEVNLAMETLKVVAPMTPTAVERRAVDNNNKAGTVINNKEADMVVNNKEVDMVVNKVVNKVAMIVTIE